MKTISDMKDVELKSDSVILRMKRMVEKLRKHNVTNIGKAGEDPNASIDMAASEFAEVSTKVVEIKD